MLFVKVFHCLLLGSAILGARFIVMRSEVRFGELGALWRRIPDLLMMGTRWELRVAYGMLTGAVEAKCVKQCLAWYGSKCLFNCVREEEKG